MQGGHCSCHSAKWEVGLGAIPGPALTLWAQQARPTARPPREKGPGHPHRPPARPVPREPLSWGPDSGSAGTAPRHLGYRSLRDPPAATPPPPSPPPSGHFGARSGEEGQSWPSRWSHVSRSRPGFESALTSSGALLSQQGDRAAAWGCEDGTEAQDGQRTTLDTSGSGYGDYWPRPRGTGLGSGRPPREDTPARSLPGPSSVQWGYEQPAPQDPGASG